MSVPYSGTHLGGLDLSSLLHGLYFGGSSGLPINPLPTHGVPAIHGFGPGGAVTATPESAPMSPGPYVGTEQGLAGGAVHPAIVALLHAIGNHLGQQAQNIHPAPGLALHETGHDAQGLQVWEQHHPGAMRTGHFIPDWVRHQMHPNQGRTAVHPATIQ